MQPWSFKLYSGMLEFLDDGTLHGAHFHSNMMALWCSLTMQLKISLKVILWELEAWNSLIKEVLQRS